MFDISKKESYCEALGRIRLGELSLKVLTFNMNHVIFFMCFCTFYYILGRKMKTLIIGSNGQLGKQMCKTLSKHKYEFDAYDLPQINISNIESIQGVLKRDNYGTIINCAAYTNVDKAEADRDEAYKINSLGPNNIAMLCDEYGLDLFHISTDYVFSGSPVIEDGKPRPYIETDICSPNTTYGRTKLAGEEFVRQIHRRHYILRTAWLYGEGNNFVKTMLALSKDKDEISVVDDQYGSPTSTVDLAETILALIGTNQYGTYHATCEGFCTWYEFAKKIFEIKKVDIKVVPISSKEFVRPAKRPAWSVLDNKRLKKLGMNNFRNWEVSLKEYLDNFDD